MLISVVIYVQSMEVSVAVVVEFLFVFKNGTNSSSIIVYAHNFCNHHTISG